MIESVEYETAWHGAKWRESAPAHVPTPLPDLPSATKALGLLCEHGILDALKHGYRTRGMLMHHLRAHSASSVTAALQRLKRRKVIAARTVYMAKRERMGIVWGLAGAPLPAFEKPTEKPCKGPCRQVKPLEAFGVCQSRHDKRARICKECIGEYNRGYKRRRADAA